MPHLQPTPHSATSLHPPDEFREFTAQWLGTHLRRALREGQFELHYQPIVCAQRSTAALEALVRFRHPKLGLVPPTKFIPLAERNGMIVPIGEWVLQQSCRQAAEWLSAGITRPVCLNVSTRQLDRAFIRLVEQALETSKLPPSMLQFEITESFALSNWTEALYLTNCLKRMGAKIAIDDFGTGYSSLTYLKRLPIDIVKIDRSFIESIDDPACGTRHIVSAIVSMSRGLGMSTVAEGVETESQFHALQQIGCDLFQGFLFSRPQPAELVFSQPPQKAIH